MIRWIIILILYIPLAQAGSNCGSKFSDELNTCLSANNWIRKHNENGISVYMRHKQELYELFMKTRIKAPSSLIYSTLVDFNSYTSFMPKGLACSKVMLNDGHKLYAWQRINFNFLLNIFIDDQYYLIDIDQDDSHAMDNRYRIGWQLSSDKLHQIYRANGKKCTEGKKIKLNSGYWEIAELEGGISAINYYAQLVPSGKLAENFSSFVAMVTREGAPETLLKLKNHVEAK